MQVGNNITVFVHVLVSIVASEEIAVNLTDAPLEVNCLVYSGSFQDFLCVFGFRQFHYFVFTCWFLFIYCRGSLGLLDLWIGFFFFLFFFLPVWGQSVIITSNIGSYFFSPL